MMFLAERLRVPGKYDICLVLDFVPPPSGEYTFHGHILFHGTKAACEAFIAAREGDE